MDRTYLNSGNLFKNNFKTSDKHPAYKGEIELSKELLKEMVARANGGKKIIIEGSVWINKSDRAGTYLSLKVQKLYEKGETNDEQPQSDDIPF